MGRDSSRLYPYRSKIYCNQCHRRMHRTQRATAQPGQALVYYVCPTRLTKPEDHARWPGHLRASLREDVLTAKLSEFLDTYALGHDRAARLAELIPASQAQQAKNRKQSNTHFQGSNASFRFNSRTNPKTPITRSHCSESNSRATVTSTKPLLSALTCAGVCGYVLRNFPHRSLLFITS